MSSSLRSARASLVVFAAMLVLLVPSVAHAKAGPPHLPLPPQETGFLNRTIELQGITYKFQIYLPEDFHRPQVDAKSGRVKESDQLPIVLFLHGRGERGSEGMWQTQVGLPQEIRDHPERWPFIVVMPQCSLRHFWTDPDMLQMAIAALEMEQREFHADPDRVYLTGLSLGGYGAWELARLYPHRWAAIAIAASGVFWSYAPDRWRDVATLPGEYARKLGRTPVWLFHGAEDTTVVPRQSELMFDALKAESGHVRLWVYQGLHHDCWTRAFNEPELPRWLLAHHLNQLGQPVHDLLYQESLHPEARHAPEAVEVQLLPLAERISIPLHPPALKLPPPMLDTYVGEYRDNYNVLVASIQRQGEQLFLRNPTGDVLEIAAESTNTFFYATISSQSRLTFEHDPQGHITGILFRDDRHEERWEKRR